MDPWTAWIEKGENPAAFPYGYVMWFFFVPFMFITNIFSAPIYLAYGAILLLADFILLIILKDITATKSKSIVLFYWLSPITIIPTYFLGYNDIIPVLFLFTALYFVKSRNTILAGVFLIAAISAKLSMILAAPFFIIYLFNNKIY